MKHLLISLILACALAGCGTPTVSDAALDTSDAQVTDATDEATMDATAMDAPGETAMPPLEASVMDVALAADARADSRD